MKKATVCANKMLLQTTANKIALRTSVIAVAEEKRCRGWRDTLSAFVASVYIGAE